MSDETVKTVMSQIEASKSRSGRSLLGKSWAGTAMLLAIYLLLLAVFTLLSPFFLTFKNLLSIGSNMAFVGLMAAAGTPLIIAGGLDLSVAAIAEGRRPDGMAAFPYIQAGKGAGAGEEQQPAAQCA